MTRRSCACSRSAPAHRAARDPHRQVVAGAATARPSAPPPNRPRPPTSARSPTGRRPRPKERAPARHRGAHLVARQAGSSAAERSPKSCALARRRRRPRSNSPKSGEVRPDRLDFHASAGAVATGRAPLRWVVRGTASELANTRSCLAGLNQAAPSGGSRNASRARGCARVTPHT